MSDPRVYVTGYTIAEFINNNRSLNPAQSYKLCNNTNRTTCPTDAAADFVTGIKIIAMLQ